MIEYGILEEQLFNDIDEILLEGFPPIILGLKKKYKDKLAQYFYVGPNSQQKKITKEEAIKAPYSTGLLILLDSDYEPTIALLGSKLIELKDKESDPYHYGWRRRGRKKETTNRKKELDKAQHIYYISPDKETVSQITKRETSREEGKPYLFKKEDIETIQSKQSFNKIKDEYLKRKIKEVQKELPTFKNNLEKLMDENRKEYIKKLNTTRERYSLNDDLNEWWNGWKTLKQRLIQLKELSYSEKEELSGIVNSIVLSIRKMKVYGALIK